MKRKSKSAAFVTLDNPCKSRKKRKFDIQNRITKVFHLKKKPKVRRNGFITNTTNQPNIYRMGLIFEQFCPSLGTARQYATSIMRVKRKEGGCIYAMMRIITYLHLFFWHYDLDDIDKGVLVANISRLCTHPHCQRLGIGRHLIGMVKQEVIKYGRKLKAIDVKIALQSTDNAISFYKRLGMFTSINGDEFVSENLLK